MIVTLILKIIYVLVYGLLSVTILLLPDVSASSSMTQAVLTAAQYLANFNQFLPLSAIFSVLAAILAVEIVIALYKLIMWVIRRLPTQS